MSRSRDTGGVRALREPPEVWPDSQQLPSPGGGSSATVGELGLWTERPVPFPAVPVLAV